MSVVLWSFHLKTEGVVEPPQEEERRAKGGRVRFVDVPERKEEARKQAGEGHDPSPKHLARNRPGLPPEAETAMPEIAPKFEPLVVDPKRFSKIVAQTPPVVRDSQPRPQWQQDEEELLIYLMARAA